MNFISGLNNLVELFVKLVIYLVGKKRVSYINGSFIFCDFLVKSYLNRWF